MKYYSVDIEGIKEVDIRKEVLFGKETTFTVKWSNGRETRYLDEGLLKAWFTRNKKTAEKMRRKRIAQRIAHYTHEIEKLTRRL